MNWLKRTIDLWDGLWFVATVLIGYGVWGYDPRLALITVGVLMLVIAILGASKSGNTHSGV